MRIWIRALAVAALATLLLAPGAVAAPKRTVSGPLVPSSGVLVGAAVEARPAPNRYSDANRRASLVNHEDQIQRNLDIANDYWGFFDDWKVSRLNWNIDNGRIPSVSWNGHTPAEINSGKYDWLIRKRAAQAKQIKGQFLLRFHWEPESKTHADWNTTPYNYKKSWKRVQRIFDEENVTNAEWTWCGTAWGFKTGEAQKYYPGDAYVDWVCANGYSWTEECRHNAYKPFESTFSGFFAFGEARNKPMMVGEWGASGSKDGKDLNKAKYFASVVDAVEKHPNLAALVVFDREDPHGRPCDFKIDTSTRSLNAYRNMVNDPALSTTGGGQGTTTTTPTDNSCVLAHSGSTVTLTWGDEGGTHVIRRNGKWLATPGKGASSYVDKNAPAGATYVVRTHLSGAKSDRPCQAN